MKSSFLSAIKKHSILLTFILLIANQNIIAQGDCTPPSNPPADIVLTQDYSVNWDSNNPTLGSIEEYRPASGSVDNMIIDGYNAFWIFQNNGQYPNDPTTENPSDTGAAITKTYPIQLYQQNGTFFRRARIKGYTSLTSEWGPTYLNGSAFLVRQSTNVTVEDIRADRVWDALRSSRSENTTFKNCWMSRIRDDSVENDHLKSVTLVNILFEDAFVGISMRPVSGDATSDGTGHLVTLDNVHLYLSPYWYNTNQTNATATIFKTSSSHVMPQVLIMNSVFGWEIDPTVNNPSNITNVMGNVHPNSGNNTALWMSLDPPPSWFYDEAVLPSAVFTNKIIGQAAINFAANDKEAFKAQWISDCRPILEGDNDQTLFINDLQEPITSIMVYPNPATEYVQLKLEGYFSETIKAKVFDIKGRLVLEQDFNNESEPILNVNELVNGVYFISLEHLNFKDTVKIIKQ